VRKPEYHLTLFLIAISISLLLAQKLVDLPYIFGFQGSRVTEQRKSPFRGGAFTCKGLATYPLRSVRGFLAAFNTFKEYIGGGFECQTLLCWLAGTMFETFMRIRNRPPRERWPARSGYLV